MRNVGFRLNGKEEDLIEVKEFINLWNDSSQFIETSTSGTTSYGTLVRIDKNHMRNSALSTGHYFDFKRGDNALLCMNPNFIGGKMMIVRAMLFEMNLWVVKPSLHPFRGIEKSICFSFVAMTPVQIQNSIMDEVLNNNRVKNILLGGAAVSRELEEKLQNINAHCFHSFATTETTSHIAIRKLNGECKSDVFVCMEGVCVGTDDRGCLWIDAPKVAVNRVQTNDMVECILSDSFRWLGRYDNLINTGGVKINPEEVERIIEPYIQERYYIHGVADEQWGNAVVLLVEGEEWSEERKRKFINKVKPLLKDYAAPKRIEFVCEFEETQTGKIKRKH